MSRRGRSGRSRHSERRNPNRFANRRSIAPEFDEDWLDRLKERFDARYVDLTRYEDRRRWHPVYGEAWTKQPAPRAFRGKPRILIVPQRHKLARFQTFGGLFSLAEVRSGRYYQRYRQMGRLPPNAWPYGSVDAWHDQDISKRVGYHLPWEVIVCVRRKRRREVLHALQRVGRGNGGGKPRNTNFYSEVRC